MPCFNINPVSVVWHYVFITFFVFLFLDRFYFLIKKTYVFAAHFFKKFVEFHKLFVNIQKSMSLKNGWNVIEITNMKEVKNVLKI